MDIKKIGILCLALSVLAYAQALDEEKPENLTIPLEFENYESYTTDIPKDPESFTATTVSPFDKVPETPGNPSEIAQPESEIPEEPTKVEETKIIYIDENGVKVDYDKNLYYCENCSEEETEETENENNDNKKLIFSTSEEELSELTDNDSYEIADADHDLSEDSLHDDEDIIDFLIGYDEEPLYDDDDIDEDIFDDLMEYDEPLLDEEVLADEISEESVEGSGF